jgi:L-lactate dehydrogenase
MKVGIVGSDFVGSTAAYALVMQGVGREIVPVDKNANRAEAEVDDIRHAVPFAHPLEVRAGNYEDLVGGQGVLETVPLPLNDAESAGLRASAGVIRAALDELGDNLY